MIMFFVFWKCSKYVYFVEPMDYNINNLYTHRKREHLTDCYVYEYSFSKSIYLMK